MLAIQNIKERECYWIPHPSKVYKMVMIQKIEGNSCLATTTDDNTEIELDIPDCPFYPVNPSAVDDMTSLHFLHEAGILSNLEERSKLHNQIPYTYVSNVLIAVNPLRKVPEYAIEKYLGTPISAVPPHPYGIAEMAYRQMILPKVTNRNQSIVISGESGAGKTETAKIVLKYLCWRSVEGNCGGVSSVHTDLKNKNEKSLDNALLQSNPILESFGNAKTQRNDNSSRFGKFLKLQFDPNQNFAMVSAGIDTYLLEKSRVVSVTEGERNYHVFYELIGGATETLKKKLRLKALKNYRYLNMSSETDIPGVNNKVNFATLKQAMSFVGMNINVEQDCIFRTLSAILTLGNAEFVDVTDENGSECAVVVETYLIGRVAELLGVDKTALELSLTTKYFAMETSAGGRRRSNIRSPRNAAQAAYCRDAMSKSIYQRVFDWIVKKISQSLYHQPNSQNPFIGVLDIFGFEDFTTNGLEQLLINYANEALQSIYSKEVLVTEHALFVEEGLQDVHVGDSFKFNDGCIDLIGTGSKSIISYLDSVCVRPGIEEEVFTSLLHTNLSDNPFFPPPRNVEKREKFKIKHYARTVTYTVGSFISRNMDVRLPELEELLLSSTHNSKCCLFADVIVPIINNTTSNDEDDLNQLNSPQIRESRVSSLSNIDDSSPIEGRETRVSSMSKIDSMKLKLNSSSFSVNDKTKDSQSPNSGPGSTTNKTKGNKQYTVGGSFIKRMAELTKTLTSTKCSFIRCIKPNPTMTPGKFDNQFVVDQLRCLGVIQTCEVLKAGMPTRIKMNELEIMYRPLLPIKLQQILQHISEDAFIRALMWAFQIPTDSYKIGKTRVFFRIGKISLLSELTDVDINSERGQWIATRLKRYVARIWWRKALIKMLCDYTFTKLYEKSKLRITSATIIQRSWKKFINSEKKVRQKYIRHKWYIAYLFVKCQNIFLKEYLLIREATNMRLAAEAYAEETVRKMKEAEAAEEEARLKEQNELNNNNNNNINNNGGDKNTLNNNINNNGNNNNNNSISGNNNNNNNNNNLNDVNERGRSQSNAVTLNQAKMKAEMQALVAASSLATVSVCLFRWTKIKLFAAFETWLAILPPEVLEQQQRLKPLSTRASMDEFESVSFDKQSSDDWSPSSSPLPPQIKNDLLKDNQTSSSLLATTAGTTTTTAATAPNTSFSPLPSSLHKNLSQSKPSDISIHSPKPQTTKTLNKKLHDSNNLNNTNTSITIASTGTTGTTNSQGLTLQTKDSLSNLNLVKSKNIITMQLQDTPITDGKCYECEQRESVLWCPDCGQDYCKVCSQFVHECCKIMKTHIPVPIDHKKFTPIRRLIPVEGNYSTTNSIPFENTFSRRRTHSDSVILEENIVTSFHEDDPVLEPVQEDIATPDKSRTTEVNHSLRRRRLSFQTKKQPSNAEVMPFAMSMTRGGDDHSHKDPCSIKSCTREACKGISIRFCEEHYEEFRASMKGGQNESENETKTLQQQVALLKRQLQESGQQPVEFVELSVARERMQQAVQRLMGGEEAAEKDIERWDKAIRMNPEYQKEMEEKAKQWEIDQKPINHQCLLKMRSLIPPNVAATSMQQMIQDGLPKSIANRIWTKKSLWIINTHPDDTRKVHIADLNTKYGNQGLDIIEMRAIWANLPDEFDNDGDGKKAQWRALFRQKLEELTVKEASNRLSAMEKRNPAYKGFDNLSVYDPNVEISRAAIQKSTAFDVTEKPEIKSTLGDGIKELKKQMAAAEKPLMEGQVVFLPQGSGDADGGRKVWITLLLQKKTVNIYSSQKASESDPPETEFIVQQGHTIKSGPGKATVCIMSGETEVCVFQDKAKRDKWVEALNEIVKLVNTVPKIQKKAPTTPTPVAAEEPPERPKPSFLAGIASKKKGGDDGGDSSGSSNSTPAEKPSFLAAIAAGKKKSGGNNNNAGGDNGGGGGEKPSFLSAISARKKGGDGDSNDSSSKPAGNPLLAGIAARRKDPEDIPTDGSSTPTPTDKKKKKEMRTEDI